MYGFKLEGISFQSGQFALDPGEFLVVKVIVKAVLFQLRMIVTVIGSLLLCLYFMCLIL